MKTGASPSYRRPRSGRASTASSSTPTAASSRRSNRIVFHADSGFFEKIEVSIAIADPDEHFHVPLLLSPYSCVIYRGS